MTRLHFGANDVTSTEKGEETLRIWLSGWRIVFLCLVLPTHSYTQNSSDDLPILDLDTPIRMNFAGNWEKDFGRSDNCCLLYTSPSPRDGLLYRMPSSA